MQLFSEGTKIFKKKKFAHKKLKKPNLKSCSEKLKSTFFSLLPWAAQTEEFMFQIAANRPTVCRTGALTEYYLEIYRKKHIKKLFLLTLVFAVKGLAALVNNLL